MRIPRPKIEELALQTKGVGIFTVGEYLEQLQKTPDRQIGDFGFYRAIKLLLKMRTAFRCIATKSSAHTTTGWGAERQCKMQNAKCKIKI